MSNNQLNRPDGNCFYSAFSFSLFESILGSVDKIAKIKSEMKKSRNFLIETLSYPDITVDDFYDTGNDSSMTHL